MKNATKRLEKSPEFWIILSIALLFFFLRVPSLFEPDWYGDEGIYQTIAVALNQGRLLYTEIWDNKPPLLYYTYSLVNGDLFLIRLLSLITGLLSVVAFSLLAKSILKKTTGIIAATLLFSILFGLPILEGNIANAENFMLLPILTGALLVYRIILRHHQNTNDTPTIKLVSTRRLILPGILLGIAFLYKIVAVFDFAAIVIFIIFCLSPKKPTLSNIILFFKTEWRILATFSLGFLLPFLLSLIFFGSQGAFSAYIQAIFLSTFGYVGYGNVFLVPQGLLIGKTILLGIVLINVFVMRKRLAPGVIFIIIWLGFSVFNSFFSQRPYTHYLIVLIAPLSLLFGLIFTLSVKRRAIPTFLFICIAFITLNFFDHWSIQKTGNYYINFISYINNQSSMRQYYSFFDRKALRDEQIATFIDNRSGIDRSLFMWGNSAQLYYLTKTLPPGRFTVAYHISGIKPYLDETGLALTKPPHFIIILDNAPIYPFPMYNYRQVLKIEEANIYERTY